MPGDVSELVALRDAIPPNWQAWTGVTGRLYVRRLLTSPPRTLGGTAAGELARQAGTIERLYTPDAPEGD
jgi:hypothetical protein